MDEVNLLSFAGAGAGLDGFVALSFRWWSAGAYSQFGAFEILSKGCSSQFEGLFWVGPVEKFRR